MKPITHLSLNIFPDKDVDTTLLSLRVIPDGREGNTVFGRTLRCKEAADGMGVVVKGGEEFTIRAGQLVVELEHVDRLSEPRRGGLCAGNQHHLDVVSDRSKPRPGNLLRRHVVGPKGGHFAQALGIDDGSKGEGRRSQSWPIDTNSHF